MTYSDKPQKALRLICGTRLTFEKGGERMKKFATLLHEKGIPFIWTVFSNKHFETNIPGVVYMEPTMDIKSYMLASDYVVQLSDSEGFCYSIVEALELGIPVLTTPIDVLPELGFVDGKHGYILPFEMDDIDIDKIIKGVPSFKYNNKNKTKINQWKELLGDTVPVGNYKYDPQKYIPSITVKVTKPYNDLVLKRKIKIDEILTVTAERAEQLYKAKVAIKF